MEVRKIAIRFIYALLYSSMVATIMMLLCIGVSALLGDPFGVRALGAIWGAVLGVEMHHAYKDF